MQWVLDHLSTMPTWAVYDTIAGLVFGEAALFVGFVLPGETAVLLGGFLASTGHLSILVLSVLVVAAAILGTRS